MEFKEEELEQIIWDASQNEEGRYELSERGLTIEGDIYRQVKLSPYGRADLITFNSCLNIKNEKVLDITIYELKKATIDEKTLMQASRYATGIREYLGTEKCYVNLRLIGTKIEKSNDFVFLYSNSYGVEIYICTYKVNGIQFEYQHKDWYKAGEKDEDTLKLIEELKVKYLNEVEEEKQK